jgi:hypothetical protein
MPIKCGEFMEFWMISTVPILMTCLVKMKIFIKSLHSWVRRFIEQMGYLIGILIPQDAHPRDAIRGRVQCLRGAPSRSDG